MITVISVGTLLIAALICVLLSAFPGPYRYTLLATSVAIVIFVLLVSGWPLHLPALIRVR